MNSSTLVNRLAINIESIQLWDEALKNVVSKLCLSMTDYNAVNKVRVSGFILMSMSKRRRQHTTLWEIQPNKCKGNDGKRKSLLGSRHTRIVDQ